MIKAKGLYEWKLINADTGEIDKEGQQWNTVSDRMIDFIFVGANENTSSAYLNGLAVQLSDTVPTPGVDYRRAGASNSFNRLATGSLRQRNVNFETMSKYTDYNFSPPGSPRTIRVLGVKIYHGDNDRFAQPNFVSFVELSTPITQNTNQYFYVKYTINFSYISGGRGYNTPNNRYIQYGFNNSLFTYGMLSLGRVYYTDSDYHARFWVTQFLPPSNIDNMMRAVQHRYVSTYTERTTNYGNTYGATLLKNFAVGDIPGPVGAVLIQGVHNGNLDGYYTYFQTALGYSPSANITPSVSRVFLHPQGRESAYFSDPSYPASSQGAVLISGTPTNKYTIVGRIRITKTGDASDLVDEVVNSSDVDIDADTITVTQNIGLGDKYRLTTTGSLPSPLVAGIDYYVINVNPTTIKLAATYSNALAGNAIPIDSQGTGDHTLTRQNTGQYRLELAPWTSGAVHIHQLSMGVDYDGYVMPQDLNSTTDYYTNYAEGDYIANTADSYRNQLVRHYTASMIRGAVKNGDYIYTVQQSRKGLINNVCRWLFNTVETSQPLCKFGTSSTRVIVPLDTGTKMYIFTNEGVYEYTYATPTVAPVLLTITGLIETDILDACWDPITGYFWTGHVSGLSRIDIGALTAKQYLTGAGQELEGMTANEVLTACGQLEAYNGRVLRGGYAYYDGNYSSTGRSTAWVLQDGVGYYRANGSSICNTCCLRKDTNQIVWANSNKIIIYDIIVTGKNMGSSTQYSSLDYEGDSTYWCNMSQYSKDNFIMMYSTRYESAIWLGIFNADSNTFSVKNASLPVVSTSVRYFCGETYSMGALKHCKIDLDGNGTLGFMYHKYLIVPPVGISTSYGWDGSTWVRDNPNSRNIPKTSSHPLLSGLAVSFNNATGGAWDQQFISGEQYTYVYGPTVIKDNLQTMQIKTRQYVCEAYVVENYSITVPSSSPYTITIPEASDPDFRDMDPTDFITFVYEGATRYTVGTDPLPTNTYKADTSGVFSFSSTDAGKTLNLTYTYSKFTV